MNLIANKFSIRAKLLKGDLPKSGADITTSMGSNVLNSAMQRPTLGLHLPRASRPMRPPPGLPVPPQFGSQGGLSLSHEGDRGGNFGKIGDAVTQLSASIVGCHREAVRRETGLENCPSSNLHQFVPQHPHSRHEFISPSSKATVERGNNYHAKTRFYFDSLRCDR